MNLRVNFETNVGQKEESEMRVVAVQENKPIEHCIGGAVPAVCTPETPSESANSQVDPWAQWVANEIEISRRRNRVHRGPVCLMLKGFTCLQCLSCGYSWLSEDSRRRCPKCQEQRVTCGWMVRNEEAFKKKEGEWQIPEKVR